MDRRAPSKEPRRMWWPQGNSVAPKEQGTASREMGLGSREIEASKEKAWFLRSKDQCGNGF